MTPADWDEAYKHYLAGYAAGIADRPSEGTIEGLRVEFVLAVALGQDDARGDYTTLRNRNEFIECVRVYLAPPEAT